MKAVMPLGAYAAVAGVALVVVAAWLAYAEFSEKVARVEALSAQVESLQPDDSDLRAAVVAAQAQAADASRRAGRALRVAQAPVEMPVTVSPAELTALASAVEDAVSRLEAVEKRSAATR